MKIDLREKVINKKAIELAINKYLVCFLIVRRYKGIDYKAWAITIKICNTKKYAEKIDLCKMQYYNIVEQNNRYFLIADGYFFKENGWYFEKFGDYENFQFENINFNNLKNIKRFLIDIVNLQLKNIKKKFDINKKIAFDMQNFLENHRKLN